MVDEKQPDSDVDSTDNDVMDEGLTVIKEKGFPSKEQQDAFYAYAEKVSKRKYRKSLYWKIIASLSFWMYIIFNFIKDWLAK